MIPIYVYGVISTRRLLYFTAANPGIEMGGFFGEKKDEILSLIDEKYKVKGFRVSQPVINEKLIAEMQNSLIDFPVVAKPNVGERGFGVQIIENLEDLYKYAACHDDFIIQEYVDFPLELGVLYCRYPNASKGRVTSLSRKQFLSVNGDGIRTVRELLQDDKRNQLYLKLVEGDFVDKLNVVPSKNENFTVHRIGNHSKGTQFIDESQHLSRELSNTFDTINSNVKGVYYGRYDLKVPSFKHLINGENIKIFELNGVSSEPGHVYDQSNVIEAFRILAVHWLDIIKISKQNIENGVVTTPLKIFIWKLAKHFL